MEVDHSHHIDRGRPDRRRQLTILIAWCAAHVVLAALTAVLLARPEAYRTWQELSAQGSPADYSALLLTRFVWEIFVPVALALYSYFTLERLGTPPLYRLIWGLVVFTSALWKLLTFETYSPFWYLSLALWLGLLLTVINIHRLEPEYPKKEGPHGLSKNRP